MNTQSYHRSISKYCVVLILFCTFAQIITAQSINKQEKPRIVVTADPELDDNNSLIRFILYSCDFNVEGLVYASSGFHWKGDGKGTKWYVPGREYSRFGIDTCPCESWRWAKDEHFIHNIVEAYGKVYPNLKIHNSDYPSPDYLKEKIRYGNIEFDGDISMDSPGSVLIKSLILDDRPGKLYITAWGGQSTIARALKSIQEQYEYTTEWDNIRNKISRKVVILPSGDQDDTYATYIKPNWPDIDYRQFAGGPNYSYGAQLGAKPQDSVYLTSSWMKENVTDRGPLGALYRVWGDGKQMVKGDKMDYFGLSGYSNDQLRKMGYAVWMPVQDKGSWLGEGDDFTFMNMPGNGLRAFEEGTFGGWGGVQIRSLKPISLSSVIIDTTQQNVFSMQSLSGKSSEKEQSTFPDFFPAAQCDFAARLKWSVTPNYSGANHSPVIRIEGPLTVLASPGESIRLNVSASDPDNNTVTLKWWQFDVASCHEKVKISEVNSNRIKVQIPTTAESGQTIHIICEASDNGTPSLTSYKRIIIKIRDK